LKFLPEKISELQHFVCLGATTAGVTPTTLVKTTLNESLRKFLKKFILSFTLLNLEHAGN
jgi:hypothetical protein